MQVTQFPAHAIPSGHPPLPFPERSSDVRHLVVCAYGRCRQLGDDRDMITVPSTDFQSKPGGRACYHGRCYAKKFGVPRLLSLSKNALYALTLGDIGPALMKAIINKYPKRDALAKAIKCNPKAQS